MPCLSHCRVAGLGRLAAVVLLWLGMLPPAWAVITLDSATFSRPGDPRWQTVRLPDTWRLRGEAAMQVGQYRVQFELDQAPDQPWALRIDRLSTRHEVRLNGRVVHRTPDGASRLRRPMPTLLMIPPDLLVAGSNTLDVRVDAGARAGLSPLIIGPEPEVADGFQRNHLVSVGLPQGLNAAGAGLALFMLLIWSRRRQEVALGSFAALYLLTSLRNVGYFAADFALSTVLTDWVFFLIQVLSVTLLGLFAMHFAQRPLPAFRIALLASALLLPTAGGLAAVQGQLHTARAWLYPILVVLSLPSLALVLNRARARRTATDAVLAAALLAALGCAVHDYLLQQGHVSIMSSYWLPFAVPIVLMVFSAVLLGQLVRALSEVEQLNLSLEARVAQRTRELRDAIDSKDRFLAVASHDLRQPLLSISLLAGLLQDHVAAPAARGLFDRMGASIQALETMMKRLLDLSRLETGRVPIQRTDFALRPLLQRICEDNLAQAEARGLTVRLRCPPCAAVHGDAALLEQVVRNLVGNAVQHTRQGGVLVAARPRRSAGQMWLEVRDTGPGLPASLRRLLAGSGPSDTPEPMAASVPPRPGLGLSIVGRIVALLGLPITVSTIEGRGTCLRLVLPEATLADAATGVVRPAVSRPSSGGKSGPLEGRRLWLLEDDADVRRAVLSLLCLEGADVRVFASLAEIRHASTGPDGLPDLLLADQHLPDGHIFDLLGNRNTSVWREVAVVVMTGHATTAGLQALREEAGVQVLLKPFGRDALLAALAAPGVV